MKGKTLCGIIATVVLCMAGCSKENNRKDRGDASDMFERICNLTKEYTEKLQTAPDSADWASVCSEYEEKLDKISFSYAPDTDLLLTEGQNDTIHALMQEYVKIRDQRIHGLLHPEPEIDSLALSDSLEAEESASKTNGGSEDASRSRGN